jgi:hypothetical protein
LRHRSTPAGSDCAKESGRSRGKGHAGIPISEAWTCCFLVSSCLAVYDLERAFAWSDRIAAFATRYGSRWMLALALLQRAGTTTHLCHARIALDRGDARAAADLAPAARSA